MKGTDPKSAKMLANRTKKKMIIEIAKIYDTISYELLTNISERIHRKINT